MSTLMKELISIPETVHKGDFVLRLTEGIQRPEETLANYVVTPQLVKCFDRALSLIQTAMQASESKATYLHGSFGSGKSHFMAILHLLLQHESGIRKEPELAEILAKHEKWLKGKKFLMVPYHMLAARNMETAILGGYAEHVRRIHPRCRPPAIYVADAIFENAKSLRKTMGDEAFFAALSSASDENDDGWGELGGGWDAARFESALEALPGDGERESLISDLVATLFTAHDKVAANMDTGTVSLDEGLAIITRHARELGYDGIVLFLDELILWLASMIADRNFVYQEAQKLAKLVEAGSFERVIPIVSFIARQRDLRDLVGEHVPGVEKCTFTDTLRWSDGRFDMITLEDRNLPTIVEKRILKPVSPQAKVEIDEAFERCAPSRQETLEILLGEKGNREEFRALYPFSPAFVQALVALSSALQRERTALKVLIQLLSQQREHLSLGDLVPVGDLWDAIASGDEPLTEEMRDYFDAAQKLYGRKLRPFLEKEHGMREEEAASRPPDDREASAFRTDARLLKTLLLAALVPEVEAFRHLTAERLAALNHGTIKSPLKGQEARVVLQKLRKAASQIGEIKIGDEGTNPSISLQLTGVDTESIIKRCAHLDKPGARQELVRKMLYQDLGLDDGQEGLFSIFRTSFRNTEREVEVLFVNVRDRDSIPDSSFENEGERWRVVIDYPFDEGSHSPQDDLRRVDELKQRIGSSRTFIWLPYFFHLDIQRDLGTLCILDYIMAGDRFPEYTDHLSAADRAQAKTLLENRQRQLRNHVRRAIEAAYGVLVHKVEDLIDRSHGEVEHFHCLDGSIQVQPPVGADLKSAFERLLDQLFEQQFPGHPHFQRKPSDRALVAILDELRRAVSAENSRIEIEDRKVREVLGGIAQPLRLGTMHDRPFLLERHWMEHFDRKHAADGSGPLTVAKLRSWMDDPKPMGLPRKVSDLVILAFAAMSNRAFYAADVPIKRPEIGGLRDDWQLKTQPLPDEASWSAAVDRAAALFGIKSTKLCTAATVATLIDELRSEVAAHRQGVNELAEKLRPRFEALDLSLDGERLVSTLDGVRVMDRLHAVRDDLVIDELATVEIHSNPQHVGTAIKSAKEQIAALENTEWSIFVSGLGAIAKDDPRWDRAQKCLAGMKSVVADSEFAVATKGGLRTLLKTAQAEAGKILADRVIPPPPPPPPPPPVVDPKVPPPPPGVRTVQTAQKVKLNRKATKETFAEIEKLLADDEKAWVDISWTVYSEGPKK